MQMAYLRLSTNGLNKISAQSFINCVKFDKRSINITIVIKLCKSFNGVA